MLNVILYSDVNGASCLLNKRNFNSVSMERNIYVSEMEIKSVYEHLLLDMHIMETS